MTSSRLTVESVNFDCADPERLAAFWAAATGGSVTGRYENYVFVSPPSRGGVTLYFQRVPGERSGRNSIHLDLATPPGGREAEVRRLVELGATKKWDVVGEVPWVDWTTMADPEGNLFCVGASHS
ncbi:VOC family protein [Actinoplanes sp. NPDC049548]|uniref:VOC family protein n=1 Tax=Actinoplanes sp. NPDC049548 TaxID=3155152 RepID=UPI00343B8737